MSQSLGGSIGGMVSALSGAAPGGGAGERLSRFEAGPYVSGQFTVEGFDGREALSGLYRFEVTVLADGVDELTLESALLGQRASLDLGYGASGSARLVYGVVSAVRYLGTTPDSTSPPLRLRLEPRVALLKRNRRSRIFQDLTAQEIVSIVLDESNIAARWELQQSYARRTYCVQYDESDWAFVRRLLAEEGIFFYFEQPAGLLSELTEGASDAVAAVAGAVAGVVGGAVGGVAEALAPSETIVFADAASLYPALPSASADVLDTAADAAADAAATALQTEVAKARGTVLELSSTALAALVATQVVATSPTLRFATTVKTLADEDHVTAIELERAVRPLALLLRDYDYERPKLDLRASASSLTSTGAVVAAVTNVATGVAPALPLALDPARFEVYDHFRENDPTAVTKREAQTRLEQHRASAFRAKGASHCRRLAPGHRFHLENHPAEVFNREYVVTEVRHFGRRNAGAAFSRGAAQDAAPEASYRNEFGCAPATHVVRPERPRRAHKQVLETAVVVGPGGEEVYTDEHGRIKVQFHWDREGKRNEHSSCWLRVSQAWAGGQWGAQFIPRIGMEVVVGFLGGDLDRPIVQGCVYNGENATPFALPGEKSRSGFRTRSTPGGDGYNELSFEDGTGAEEVFVRAQRNLREVVRNDRTVQVLHDERVEVGHDQVTMVAGDRRETVTGNHEEVIESDRKTRVQGNASHVSEKRDERHVKGDLQWRVDGRARYKYAGPADAAYLDDYTVRAKGCHTTVVGTSAARRHLGVHVEGTVEQSSTHQTELRSDQEVLIRCGESSILLTPTSIELSSPSLVLHSGPTEIAVTEKTVSVWATQELVLRSDATTQLLGTNISITTPAALQDPAKTTKPTSISLRDPAGKPLANQRFRLTMSDGSVRTGFLDDDGCAQLPPDASGDLTFPDLGQVT